MKNYPRIYSLSTLGLIHHYENDYLFHNMRTDFVGDSGSGKSMLFHRVLRKGIHPGHLHGAVQIPVVDGADLHRDVPLVQLLSCPAVAGHALNHVIPTSSLVVSQQQNQ